MIPDVAIRGVMISEAVVQAEVLLAVAIVTTLARVAVTGAAVVKTVVARVAVVRPMVVTAAVVRSVVIEAAMARVVVHNGGIPTTRGRADVAWLSERRPARSRTTSSARSPGAMLTPTWCCPIASVPKDWISATPHWPPS